MVANESEILRLRSDLDTLKKDIRYQREPFNRVQMRKLELGNTGAARTRRIPLHYQETAETVVIDTHGSFNGLSHVDLANGSTDVVFFTGIILPIDYVPNAKMSIKYIYSGSEATNTVDWVINVASIADTGTNEVSLLSDATSVAAPAVANTMSIRSLDLTTLPEKDVIVFASIQRTVGDTNAGSVSLWSTWLEYIAFF